MKAFQKQAETSLAKAGTGLVVSTLPTVFAPDYCISAMAVWTPSASTTVAIMFVVLGLLTSGA